MERRSNYWARERGTKNTNLERGRRNEQQLHDDNKAESEVWRKNGKKERTEYIRESADTVMVLADDDAALIRAHQQIIEYYRTER